MTRAQSVAIVAFAAFTVACGGGTEKSASPAGDAATVETTAAPPTAAVAQASATRPIADFGVKECDEYLKKYTECVSTKVPEQVREAMIAAIDESKSQWKVAALTAEGRAGLAQSCTQALQAAKASLQTYGCAW
jgi:hypothetical protein